MNDAVAIVVIIAALLLGVMIGNNMAAMKRVVAEAYVPGPGTEFDSEVPIKTSAIVDMDKFFGKGNACLGSTCDVQT